MFFSEQWQLIAIPQNNSGMPGSNRKDSSEVVLLWVSTCRIIESQNHMLEKTSKIFKSNCHTNTTMLLNHVPKGHIYMLFEHLQGWWLNHFSGQPVPMPGHMYLNEPVSCTVHVRMCPQWQKAWVFLGSSSSAELQGRLGHRWGSMRLLWFLGGSSKDAVPLNLGNPGNTQRRVWLNTAKIYPRQT